jgi:hypothetical protein
MRKHIFGLSLSVAIVALGPGRARANAACDGVFQTQNPTEAQLNACLSPRPLATMSGLVAFGWEAHGGGSLGGFARVDVPFLSPLWGGVRARYQGFVEADVYGGLVISHDYGRAVSTWQSYVGSDASYNYFQVNGTPVVHRSALVLVGGLGSMKAVKNGSTDPSFEIGHQLYGGLLYQDATSLGSHATIEGDLYYNWSTSSWGALASWHNSIAPLGGVVFGMTAGWMPAEPESTIYWAIVELGYSLEI